MNVQEQAVKIRDIINEPRQNYVLRRDAQGWNKLTSSLDVVEDADMAIEAYEALPETEDDGDKYLRLYGLLQALYTQQDAVDDLCASLNILNVHESTNNDPKLKAIRDTRNDSVGHPTRRGGWFYFISRPTVSKAGYQLVSFYAGKPPRFEHIPVPDLIRDQRDCLSELLRRVVSTLEAEEQAHKEKFSMQSLAALFPHTLHYSISKLFELTIDSPTSRPQLADLGLKEVNKILDSFKSALEARYASMDAVPVIKHVYEKLNYPLEKLRAFINDKTDGKVSQIDAQAAYIFVFFINAKIHELIAMATEIDEEYATANGS